MAANIFAVYITEDEDGRVYAKAEIIGKPTIALDIGIEIMTGLKALEHDTAGQLKVQRTTLFSDHTH